MIQFDEQSAEPQDAEGAETTGWRMRPSRIPVAARVMLTVNSTAVQATIRDVSEHGVKLELQGPLPAGQFGIKLPGFPIVTGEVRWTADGQAGLRFLRPISWDHLTVWASLHGLDDRRARHQRDNIGGD